MINTLDSLFSLGKTDSDSPLEAESHRDPQLPIENGKIHRQATTTITKGHWICSSLVAVF